jgi:hypothetical protein
VFLGVGGMSPAQETNGDDVTDFFFYGIFVGEQ